MSTSSALSSVEVRRLSSGASITRTSGSEDGGVSPAVADTLSYAEWDELVDEVVERIERRVLDELDRRGRRYLPGAF